MSTIDTGEAREVVLVTGISGSGKSVALNALEDAGFYCVDNLPANLLHSLVRQLQTEGLTRVAVAVDMRSGASIAALPQEIDAIEGSERGVAGGAGRGERGGE